MIIDASIVLSALFPDEHQVEAQEVLRDHVSGRVRLSAPSLLEYEVTNAVVQAIRRERIKIAEGQAILEAFGELGIDIEQVSWQEILPLAQRFDRSAYDAAYMALAERREETLVTGDRRLYNAVHESLDWVQWIGSR
jgi:predicted nucleic acid-binding protein